MVEPFAEAKRVLGDLDPKVFEMISAIRGQPKRGFRRLSSTMARMSSSDGPLGSGFEVRIRREQGTVLSANQPLVKSEQRRWLEADRGLCNAVRSQKKRTQAEEEPVSGRKVRHPSSGATENQQLVLEEEILGDDSLVPPVPRSLTTVLSKWTRSSNTCFIPAQVRAT